MNTEDFKNRTKTFALRVIRLTEALPKNQTTNCVFVKDESLRPYESEEYLLELLDFRFAQAGGLDDEFY